MGFGKIIGLIVLLGILAIAVLAFLGFLPVVSDLIGTAKPKDLGVRYSEADYQSGLAKMKGHSVKNAEYLCITCDYVSKGSIPAEGTFTQEEFTAQMNKMNSKKGPLKDIQVKFNADGSMEASGRITDPRLTTTVYIKGRIASYSQKSVRLSLEKIEASQVALSGEQAEQVQGIVNGAISDFFNKNPGLSIESLSIGNGSIHFKGTFPQEIEGNPNVVPKEIA
ncbi:MAG: hypothetical protein QXK06_00260 [Candidatus Diapherotrites archaeon]